MPIPESQLEIWSHQGSITNSANTGNSIKTALEKYKGFSTDINFEVYLQGSYKNATNVYGESDVDVVVELTSSFYNNLTPQQKENFRFTPANYGYTDFSADVAACLQSHYGNANVRIGNKVIQIAPNSNRLEADVLVCSSYRLYYDTNHESAYHKGISFYTKNDGSHIINFPKHHSDNATAKHQGTNQWYKPTVRIFKNIRNHLVKNKGFNKTTAPSYFIECMLSNIPVSQFGADYQVTTANCINYLLQNDISNFMCLNGIRPLWGATTENWNQANAKVFLDEVVSLWNDW